ncbi:MAG: cation transporter, partial [Gammaproteobacteria bacterium]|nr:cation transporter [Gammaproteobacteria bacterium]NIR96454.1 cation transporter [Gammaproteobacteria bacterium]NIW50579.1 cation transporter [Gammaproteobacteria bacterium]NIX59925.1 cation transporter [candidate division Zixibacteria bacterium]
EYIATLIISVLLMVTGIEFIRSSIQQIVEPEVVHSRIWVLGVVLLTIIVKEVMGRISHYLGALIESDVLEA